MLRKICGSPASDSESWIWLGIADARLGEYASAVASFKQALELNPTSADAHYYLGAALDSLGKTDEAQTRYQEATRLQPGFARAHLALGNLLLRTGFPDRAETAYRATLGIEPEHPDALANLGVALKQQSRMEAALDFFSRAIRLRPNDAGLHTNIGNTYLQLEEFQSAIAAFRRALDLDPDQTGAYSGLAGALIRLGQTDEAAALLRTARGRYPHVPVLAASEADLQDTLGHPEQAAELLEPFVCDGTADVDVAVTFANIAPRLGMRERAIALLERSSTEAPLDAHDRLRAHFALGSLYDQAGEYDRAFSHFTKGNRLKPYRYDPEATISDVDAIISTYDDGYFAKAPVSSNTSRAPVFIVGMPRSGTTLLEQILASHPAVHGAGELTHIPRIALSLKWLERARGQGHISPISSEALNESAAAHLQRLEHLSGGAARVVDKLPGNFKFLGLIQSLFPNAHVIHCKRDPRDTCLSCYFHDFEGYHPYCYDLINLGIYHRQYTRLMRHWLHTLRLPILEVRYEDVVSDLDSQVRRMIAFLELEWDDRCLSFFRTGRIVNTASYEQVRRPIYSSAIGRWRKYERHLQPLLDVLAAGSTGCVRGDDSS